MQISYQVTVDPEQRPPMGSGIAPSLQRRSCGLPCPRSHSQMPRPLSCPGSNCGYVMASLQWLDCLGWSWPCLPKWLALLQAWLWVVGEQENLLPPHSSCLGMLAVSEGDSFKINGCLRSQQPHLIWGGGIIWSDCTLASVEEVTTASLRAIACLGARLPPFSEVGSIGPRTSLLQRLLAGPTAHRPPSVAKGCVGWIAGEQDNLLPLPGKTQKCHPAPCGGS